ncbi:MAG: hypothetical protein LBN34_08855 [Clostridiales Family XIII bacterium]|jgi:hypothetical protein|nr:hypothetical protein [Clostridiales Family XIII bacterium]
MKYTTRHLDEIANIQVDENYYANRGEWLDMDQAERHLAFCLAVSAHRGQPMFTGQSAAIARGIARLDAVEMHPHCISTTGKHKIGDAIHWNYGEFDKKATTEKGLLVAGPLRTICDLAKFDSPESLLVSINDCLHKNLFTKRQLIHEIKTRAGKRGNKILRRLVKYATPKCESPLETIAWIAVYKAGFKNPEQQANFRDKSGAHMRVDMYWDLGKRKVILELDGLSKYGGEVGEIITAQMRDALKNEKIREKSLVEMGYEVIRAGWKDVVSGTLVELLKDSRIPMRRDFVGSFPKGRQ